MVPVISLGHCVSEKAYDSHVGDPFLKFPDPIGDGRIGDDNEEWVDLVFL
jgi:hypothetical protein